MKTQIFYDKNNALYKLLLMEKHHHTLKQLSSRCLKMKNWKKKTLTENTGQVSMFSGEIYYYCSRYV